MFSSETRKKPLAEAAIKIGSKSSLLWWHQLKYNVQLDWSKPFIQKNSLHLVRKYDRLRVRVTLKEN